MAATPGACRIKLGQKLIFFMDFGGRDGGNEVGAAIGPGSHCFGKVTNSDEIPTSMHTYVH